MDIKNKLPALIDIGANLTNKRFDKDVNQVIKSSYGYGVKHIIITGTTLQNSIEALELARKTVFDYNEGPILTTTCGIHPHNAKDLTPAILAELRDLAMEPEVAAIGECGLDFNRNFSPRIQQEYAFEVQLQLAQEMRKPLFLHERDAYNVFADMLKNHAGKVSGVVHCFTGRKEFAKTYLDMGFYIGITGWITDDKRNKDLLEAIKYIPLDRMMVETDAPFLLPRGIMADGRNEPGFLPFIVDKIAKVTNNTYEEVAEATTKNAMKLFGLRF